jgi:hypothetical protein
MAAYKIPGFHGPGSEFQWDRTRFPTGNHIPGPAGLRLVPQGSTTPTKQAQAAPAKATALIIVGAGHDDIRKGVRFKSNKYFKKAALHSFKKYTKSHDTKIVFVKSAPEMTKLLESQPWDVVIYFGHGYLLSRTLVPGFGQNSSDSGISEAVLIQSLKKSKAKDVYLFGCRAGWTGLARSVSKSLPEVSVRATFTDLDADWIQSGVQKGKKTTLDKNEFKMREKLTEYKNGFQTENGIKTKKRKAEHQDPVGTDGDFLSEPMVDQ